MGRKQMIILGIDNEIAVFSIVFVKGMHIRIISQNENKINCFAVYFGNFFCYNQNNLKIYTGVFYEIRYKKTYSG